MGYAVSCGGAEAGESILIDPQLPRNVCSRCGTTWIPGHGCYCHAAALERCQESVSETVGMLDVDLSAATVKIENALTLTGEGIESARGVWATSLASPSACPTHRARRRRRQLCRVAQRAAARRPQQSTPCPSF